jgi:acetoin utilization protein AcuB
MTTQAIKTLMTKLPYTIARDQTMATAHHIMREHRVRHLPVLDGGALVGVVSDGDLHLVETLRDVDPNNVLVEDAMTQDVYAVVPDAPVDEVVRTMAQRKLGSAIVAEGGRVVGIFTTIDALRAFADVLETSRPPKSPRAKHH